MSKRQRRQALEDKIRAQVEAEVKAKAESEAKAEAEVKAKTEGETKVKAEPEAKDTNNYAMPKSNSVNGATNAEAAVNKHDTSMTSDELAALIKQLSNETTRFHNEIKGVAENHEQRIIGCENDIADCKRRISNLESGQPVSVAPVAQPKTGNVSVAPINNPVAQPAAPVRAPQVIAGLGRNGAGKAYKYWRAGAWGLTSDIWAAKQAGNGEYDIIWVWYVNDHIDHLLSEEEMQQHLPH